MGSASNKHTNGFMKFLVKISLAGKHLKRTKNHSPAYWMASKCFFSWNEAQIKKTFSHLPQARIALTGEAEIYRGKAPSPKPSGAPLAPQPDAPPTTGTDSRWSSKPGAA